MAIARGQISLRFPPETDRRKASQMLLALFALAAALALTACEGGALSGSVDDSSPSGGSIFGIRDVIASDGRLHVKWDPYDQGDFQAYYLYARSGDERILRHLANKASDVAWTDSNFVGGAIDYELEIHTSTGAPLESSRSFAASPASILDIEITSSHRARLHWSPGEFGNNVEGFGVSRSSGDEAERLLTETLLPTDTSVVDVSAVFGSSYEYRLISYAADGTASTSSPYPFRVGGAGHSFDSFRTHPIQAFAYGHATGSYFTLYDNVLRRIDLATHEIRATYAGTDPWQGRIRTFSLTPHQNRIYLSEGTDIHRLDPMTLEVLETISTRDVLGYDASAVSLSVADDGKALFYTTVTRGRTTYSDEFVLADLETRQRLRNWGAIGGMREVMLAPGGDYGFAVEDRLVGLWRTSGGSLHQVSADVAREGHACFDVDGVRYITSDGGYLSLFDTASQQLEVRYPLESDLKWPVVDPETGLLGGYDARGGWYLLIDLTTGEEVSRVEVVPNRIYSFGGGVLFSSNGHYLEVDLDGWTGR